MSKDNQDDAGLLVSVMAPLLRCAELLEQRCDSLEQKIAQSEKSLSSDEAALNQEQAKAKLPEVLAPIENLLSDNKINDILINGYDSVFIEKDGKLLPTKARFKSEKDLMEVAHIIAASVGRSLDLNKPYLDARLPDGSRVNIVAPPLTLDGVSISIRKFPEKLISLSGAIESGMMSADMAEFLKICGRSKANILIVGGTGAGKTTLLNGIAQYLNEDERVVTIEDAAELRLPIRHKVRMESKPKIIGEAEGSGVSIRELVANSLRMRPDRIIIGEVRGSEAFDMIQAINTGHEGSMTTIHANSPREALLRLESMIALAAPSLSSFAIKQRISSAFEVMVMVERMDDGRRVVTNITEVAGMEKETVTMQDLFKFVHIGNSQGRFINSHIVPRFTDKIRKVGLYNEFSRIFTKMQAVNKK